MKAGALSLQSSAQLKLTTIMADNPFTDNPAVDAATTEAQEVRDIAASTHRTLKAHVRNMLTAYWGGTKAEIQARHAKLTQGEREKLAATLIAMVPVLEGVETGCTTDLLKIKTDGEAVLAAS